MKKFLALSLVMTLIAPNFAHSDDSCPLSNPVYKNLRSAAAALEQKILLPDSCQDLQKKLTEASQQINNSAQALLSLKPGETNSTGQQAAANATSGIMQVGQLFDKYGKNNDKCGRALVTMSDYVVAFIDTVNGISPLLLTFGGTTALPYAVGAQILGSSVKTFIAYYNGLNVDMTSSQARQGFIENACGYYRMNETLRSLLQSLKGEVSDLDKQVTKLQGELKDLEAQAPTAPALSEQIAAMDSALKTDFKFYGDFLATFERASSTPALACILVQTQVTASQTGTFPAPAIQRLSTLANQSLSEGRAPSAHINLAVSAQLLNRPELYTFTDDAHACASRAHDWVILMGELLAATDGELSLSGRRDLSATDAGKLRKAWEAKFAKKKEELEQAKQRQSFILSLANRGAEIELSELLDVRDRIRRELFGDGNDSALFGFTHRKGPAESWLMHKWRSAGVQLKDYRKMMPFLHSNYLDKNVIHFKGEREKEFACSYAENAVLTWNTAERHVAASRLFCETFEQTINQATHPYVTEFCLGEFDRNGERISESKVGKRENEIRELQLEVNQTLVWMKDASCAIPKPLQNLPN
jgi:hypothetical protein